TNSPHVCPFDSLDTQPPCAQRRDTHPASPRSVQSDSIARSLDQSRSSPLQFRPRRSSELPARPESNPPRSPPGQALPPYHKSPFPRFGVLAETGISNTPSSSASRP